VCSLTKNIGYSSLIDYAADDKLFLQQRKEPNFGRMNWKRLAKNIQLVDNVLDFLQSFNTGAVDETDDSDSAYELNLTYLDEKTCANLEHLLLRIRHSLQATLTSFFAEVLQAEVSKWRSHWKRQLKFGGDKWCSEYSSSRRPLSTTWPWSIRPSLAVLWGVCWMFYPPAGDDRSGKKMPWAEVLETQAVFERERRRRAAQASEGMCLSLLYCAWRGFFS
jgi:hypothetical protein